jgi:hypothetical protein
VPTPVCVIMPMMVPTMAQAMPTGQRRFGALGKRVAAGGERRAAAAGNCRNQDQADDDARHRPDFESAARHRGDHQYEPDPGDVAQHDAGETERDAGAEDQGDRLRKAHTAGVKRREALDQHVNQRRQRQHQVPATTGVNMQGASNIALARTSALKSNPSPSKSTYGPVQSRDTCRPSPQFL